MGFRCVSCFDCHTGTSSDCSGETADLSEERLRNKKTRRKTEEIPKSRNFVSLFAGGATERDSIPAPYKYCFKLFILYKRRLIKDVNCEEITILKRVRFQYSTRLKKIKTFHRNKTVRLSGMAGKLEQKQDKTKIINFL
jgi:hypothetical protein